VEVRLAGSNRTREDLPLHDPYRCHEARSLDTGRVVGRNYA